MSGFKQHLRENGCRDVADDDNPWTWVGSAMFALSLVTTIGYGSFSVQTEAGKAMVVLYGMIGLGVYGWGNKQLVGALRRR